MERRLTTWHDALLEASLAAQRLGLSLHNEQLRQATMNALNFVFSLTWRSLKMREKIVTPDAVTKTGVTYTAADRLATLGTGTWPTWAAGQVAVAGTNDARITWNTGDTIKLESDLFGSDQSNAQVTVAKGWYATAHPISNVHSVTWNGNVLVGVHDAKTIEQTLQYTPIGTPLYFMVGSHRAFPEWRRLGVYPYPQTSGTLEVIYTRSYRPPVRTGFESDLADKYVKYDSQSKVQLWDGSQAVDWPSDAVGCVLRIGTATQAPGGLYAVEQPYHECMIEAIDSGDSTVAIVTPSPPSWADARKLLLSSWMDLDFLWPVYAAAVAQNVGMSVAVKDTIRRQLDVRLRTALAEARRQDRLLAEGQKLQVLPGGQSTVVLYSESQ